MSTEGLETVGVYTARGEAEVARARLDAAGISAMLQADDEGGLNPGFYSRYGVRLLVPAGDAALARDVLTGADAIVLEREMVDAMIAHARFCVPNEACGLLALDDGGRIRMVYCLSNADRSPYRYTVDPDEHFGALRHAESQGWTIGGVFHSHPTAPPVPSATDLEGALDPEWLYLIVGNSDTPRLRAFRIEHRAAREVDVVVPG